MRLNEVVQLRIDDISVLDGVDVILIRADDEGDKTPRDRCQQEVRAHP